MVKILLALWAVWMVGCAAPLLPQQDSSGKNLPTEWIDPATGHRIVRLSREPGSESLYFHQNAYTPDGKKLIITSPSGISTIDLASHEIQPVVQGKVRVIVAGRKTGDIYYAKDRTIYAVGIDGQNTRKIVDLPEGGTITTVNCDETLLAGSITHGGVPYDQRPPTTQSRGARIRQRFDEHLPMDLMFIDIQTGKISTCNHSTDWLNHIQFSPTDPTLLMFCHEGPWEKVDRIWTIRADGSDMKLIHQRTQTMEIAGHEFFSADGKMIWYDLQTPRGEDFWVGGYDVQTGRHTRYHLLRNEWSIHFNVSRDGTLFAGDGGSSGGVAHAPDGKWIYLFRPRIIKDNGPPDIDTSKLIVSGAFDSEKLVDMSKHDYTLEPNVTFTPDMKWIVFRTNMFGESQVLAVEIEKARKK